MRCILQSLVIPLPQSQKCRAFFYPVQVVFNKVSSQWVYRPWCSCDIKHFYFIKALNFKMSCCKRCKRTALLLNVDSLGQRGRDSTDNVVYVPSQWEATLQCSVVSVSLAGRIHKMIPQLQGTSHPKVTLPLVKLLVYAVENGEDVRTYLLPVGGTIPWTLTKVPSVNLGMGPRYGTGCNKIIKDGGY